MWAASRPRARFRETCSRCGSEFSADGLDPYLGSYTVGDWRAGHRCRKPKPPKVVSAPEDDAIYDAQLSVWEQELLDEEQARIDALDAEPTPIYDALVEDSRVVEVTYDGVPYGAHTIGELREMNELGQLLRDQLQAAMERMAAR